jgi:hypothetical protein
MFSAAVNMIPVVGTLKSFIELSSGNDMFTGEQISKTQATFNVLSSAIPFAMGSVSKFGAQAIGTSMGSLSGGAMNYSRSAMNIGGAAKTGTVTAASEGSAFGGALYSEKKLGQLVSYLEKRGVNVYETAGNPAFTARANGTGAMYLPANPTTLQVKHELSHFLDFKNMGFDSYNAMGRAGREASVLQRLQGNRAWGGFNEAEKAFSIQYPAGLTK